MMHTRFAYTPSNTMPLSPRAAGSIRDSRPPPSVTVYAHSQIFHDPTWHPIPGRDGPRSPHTTTSGDRLDRDSLDRERARTRERPSAGTRPRERRRSIAAHSHSHWHSYAPRGRAGGHGAMLPVVLLPRGWHAEAEAEDVGDRFVVHAGARTRARARARGEVVLFHPDARDRVGESSRAQFRYVYGGGASEVSHGYLYFAQR